MSSPRQLDVPRLDRVRFPEVGFCIYCGVTEGLTKEHIVPFGLGGNLILPESSCKECAKITGRIEATVLRGPLRPVRVVRRIQSRSKHREAPKLLPLRVRYEEDWETIDLPLEEYPLLLDFFVFDLPGYLDQENYESGVRVRGHATFSFGPRPKEVLAALGARDIQISQKHVPSEFAKMTAKVAYAMAVAGGSIDPSRGRPEVVRSILGKDDQIGRWVGTITEPRQRISDVLHFIGIERDQDKGLLIGRVQYLTDEGTPVYGVILGRLTDEFVTPSPTVAGG